MANSQRNSPSLVSIDNASVGNRGTYKAPLADSALFIFGGLYDPFSFTAGGVQPYANNIPINGILESVETYLNGAYVPVDSISTPLPGTFVAATDSPTAPLPARYTTPAGNVSRLFPDRGVFRQITEDDTLEVHLLSASGARVNRNTTPNSGVPGNFLEPVVNFNWGLQEAGVSASASGFNFLIVGRGALPSQVRVKLINASGANT